MYWQFKYIATSLPIFPFLLLKYPVCPSSWQRGIISSVNQVSDKQAISYHLSSEGAETPQTVSLRGWI